MGSRLKGLVCPNRGLAYNANASRRSWNAMRAFLTETLEMTIQQIWPASRIHPQFAVTSVSSRSKAVN
jgi:lambda repressor-like predicted transcriptional regulator